MTSRILTYADCKSILDNQTDCEGTDHFAVCETAEQVLDSIADYARYEEQLLAKWQQLLLDFAEPPSSDPVASREVSPLDEQYVAHKNHLINLKPEDCPSFPTLADEARQRADPVRLVILAILHHGLKKAAEEGRLHTMNIQSSKLAILTRTVPPEDRDDETTPTEEPMQVDLEYSRPLKGTGHQSRFPVIARILASVTPELRPFFHFHKASYFDRHTTTEPETLFIVSFMNHYARVIPLPKRQQRRERANPIRLPQTSIRRRIRSGHQNHSRRSVVQFLLVFVISVLVGGLIAMQSPAMLQAIGHLFSSTPSKTYATSQDITVLHQRLSALNAKIDTMESEKELLIHNELFDLDVRVTNIDNRLAAYLKSGSITQDEAWRNYIYAVIKDFPNSSNSRLDMLYVGIVDLKRRLELVESSIPQPPHGSKRIIDVPIPVRDPVNYVPKRRY